MLLHFHNVFNRIFVGITHWLHTGKSAKPESQVWVRGAVDSAEENPNR